MTSLSPAASAAADDALPDISPASSDSALGPVTKLAALAAVREEEDRRKRRAAAQAELQARASLVGQTALAIAAATKAGSPVRLSPQQQQGLKNVTPPADGRQPPRMSVAARARAAADLPSRPMQPPRPQSNDGSGSGVEYPENRNDCVSGGTRVAPAPSSGTGVLRGKFSKEQVQQMIDEWGRDDTSESDYYEGTSDEGSDDETYRQTLQGHHHLQYTMSNSPGPGEASSPVAGRDDEFHYQHHRVSAYHNSKRPNGIPRTKSHDEDEQQRSGGLFSSAKHWLQSQRDRLHQLELERQVEEQRRRLVEEGRKQRALEAEAKWRRAAMHSPPTNDHQSPPHSPRRQQNQTLESSSFGCIEGVTGATSSEQPEDLCNVPEETAIVSGMPSLCGFGVYDQNLDDSTDYSGVARVDSRGNILEMIPSGSLDEDDVGEMKVCMKVSSPKCTLSGEGMSVNVDLPDTPEQSEHVPEEVEEADSWVAEIKIVPEPPQDDVNASQPILLKSQMRALVASGGLPPSLNFCKWKRIYSLTRDGDSFDQFLRLVNGHDRTVLVVKTTQDRLFGGYADTRWEAKHHRQAAKEFYGSAQACLFQFPNLGTSDGREDKCIIYKWSGQNRYIQLCDATGRRVAFGGGGDEGVFGLCIEDDFRRGTTGHCSTFENAALCEEGYFDVMYLEVWGFTLDF